MLWNDQLSTGKQEEVPCCIANHTTYKNHGMWSLCGRRNPTCLTWSSHNMLTTALCRKDPRLVGKILAW